MSAKQLVRQLGPARLVFAVAVAILVGLVVWVAVRAVGPEPSGFRLPAVVLPSLPPVPVGDFASPSLSASASPSPSSSPSDSSASASPSPSPSPSASSPPASPTPTPRRSETPSAGAKPSPSPSATPAPSPSRTIAPGLTATITVSATSDTGYIAKVRVTGSGSETASWSVTVAHRGLDFVRLTATWNASGRRHGGSFIFTGGPLAPGATATFGYQMTTKNSDHIPVRPSGCTIAGGSCSVS